MKFFTPERKYLRRIAAHGNALTAGLSIRFVKDEVT
jgi:hypothetical protein